MEKLFIEETKSTPEIDFNPSTRTFTITGQSRPENVTEFYDPILEWLKGLANEVGAGQHKGEALTFEFKLEYFNSASSKVILDILKQIKEIQILSGEVEVFWYVDEGDEDIQNAGEEMSKIVKLPFIFMENLEDL